MMKKVLIFAAFAAAVLAAGCARNEVYSDPPKEEALSFGVYVPNATKSGATAVIDNTQIQTTGFGVFASHSDNSTYNSSTSKMNFMWNQQVTYADSKWSYSPVKYWPNEHGTAAVSTEVDGLSFFAYAPYVASTAAADGTVAENEWGITGFTGNNANGDPKVSYVCNSAHPVDLCWGVIDSGTTSWTDSNGNSNPLTPGNTYKDLQKPKDTPTIKFNFKHALAKVVIDVKTMETGAGLSNIGAEDDGENATGTRIYIESLTLKGGNMYNSGKLNLNNTVTGDPLWEVETSDAADNYALDITSSPLYIASTPTAWNNTEWKKATKPGVISSATELVRGMVIPKTKKADADPTTASITSVEIVYDVITKDENLAGGVSVVKNTITKTISASGFDALAAGKIYTLHLQLGMKTVDFTAEVTDWTNTDNTTVDLPQNIAS